VLVCSFWVDEGKDRQTLENVEKKVQNLIDNWHCAARETVFAEKKEKSMEKITTKQKFIFTSPSPKSPQARWSFQ
jgi:hypothetical protein